MRPIELLPSPSLSRRDDPSDPVERVRSLLRKAEAELQMGGAANDDVVDGEFVRSHLVVILDSTRRRNPLPIADDLIDEGDIASDVE